MPYKPQGPCREQHCPNLALPGERYCAEHFAKHRKEIDEARPSATARGYDKKWQKARASYLKEHPLCADCLEKGIYTPAAEVHHVIAHRGDQTLFWARENWRGLCKSCHSARTRRGE